MFASAFPKSSMHIPPFPPLSFISLLVTFECNFLKYCIHYHLWVPPVTIHCVYNLALYTFHICCNPPTVHVSVLDAPTHLFTIDPSDYKTPVFFGEGRELGWCCSSYCAGEGFLCLKRNKLSWNEKCITNSLHGRQTDLANKDFHL